MYELSLCKGDSLTATEIEQLKSVWIECFEDPEEYLDVFFTTFLPHIEVAVGRVDGKIAVASYMLPLSTSTGAKCCYLYAGGVAKEHRGQHLFKSIVDYHTGLLKDCPYYIFGVSHLIDWYKSTFFPTVYTCKELRLDNLSCPPQCEGFSLQKREFNYVTFKKLRAAFLESINYEYICYPDWFYQLVEINATYFDNIMDIISDGNDDYYIVGQYDKDILYIEETNITSDRLSTLCSELIKLYNVSSIKIKLPVSDKISNTESSVIYAGQGSSFENLWAPFALI